MNVKLDRLSAQDTSFLFAESPVAHMHVGSLVIFEDTGFSEEDFQRHILSRLHLVPRFRKKLAWVPYGQGRPVWVDDPHFDIRFHVRFTGLPKPGGLEQATRLMGRVMSVPLDRTRPLWELWVFDLPDGKKGLIQKTHHCLIDGVSGVDLGTVLLDLSDKSPRTPPKAWSPEDPPSKPELLWRTWFERATKLASPIGLLKSAQAAIAGSEAWERTQEVVAGLAVFGKAMRERAPRTSLNVPIKAHRRFDAVQADLGRIKEIKRAFDCTVNDV
ncbi:MAG: hypothetical protein KC561_05265, partial [Myxococcales bacterium]|nr:hypothetical protein [Myxococcales bacterium]